MKYNSNIIKPLSKLIFTLLIFIGIFTHYKVSISKIFSFEIQNPIWICFSILIVILINPIFASNRWKIFLHYTGIKENIFSLIKINFIACFYGIVLPSSVGMDFIRILMIEKKHPAHSGKTGSTVIAERLLGFFLLSILGIFGAFFLESNIDPHSNLIVLMLLITTVLYGLILIISNRFAFNIIRSFLSKAGQLTHIHIFVSIISYIKKLYQSLCELPLKKCFLKALPFMICFQLSNILIGCLLFYSFGIHLSFYSHLALLPIIQILTIIPFSISGFGIREGAFVYFYSSFGVLPEISIAVSILYFFIITGTSAALGGIIVLFSNIKPTFRLSL